MYFIKLDKFDIVKLRLCPKTNKNITDA